MKISEDTKDWIRVLVGFIAFFALVALTIIGGALVCVGAEWIMELKP